MCGKLLLLVVACASFVHGKLMYLKPDEDLEAHDERRVRVVSETNHFVDLLKSGIRSRSQALGQAQDEHLEDVIRNGLSSADEIFKLGVKFCKEEWTAVSEIGKMMVSNATQYSGAAELEKDRIGAALEQAATDLRNNWAGTDDWECIIKVKEKGQNDIETLVNAFKADIWRLNFDYNSTYPEFPFLLLEDALRSEYNEKIESIKRCQDRKSVQAEMKTYNGVMTDRYNSLMKTTTAANGFFFRYKLEVGEKYWEMKNKIEKIYTTAFANMRKCLPNKEVSNSPHESKSNNFWRG